MKCVREMNDRKESLKIKNLNTYFHVVVTYKHIASWGKRMTQFFV